MTTVSHLDDQATSAYMACQYREALLLFRQAAEEAAKLGNRAAWFKELIWAASSAYELNDIPLAQHLFLEARADEPSDRPTFEGVIARIVPLEITIDHRPVLSRLTEQLEELRTFPVANPVQSSDLEYLAAQIEFRRGALHAR